MTANTSTTVHMWVAYAPDPLPGAARAHIVAYLLAGNRFLPLWNNNYGSDAQWVLDREWKRKKGFTPATSQSKTLKSLTHPTTEAALRAAREHLNSQELTARAAWLPLEVSPLVTQEWQGIPGERDPYWDSSLARVWRSVWDQYRELFDA